MLIRKEKVQLAIPGCHFMQGRAVHCPLSIVLFMSNQMTSWRASYHFLFKHISQAKKDMPGIFSVSSSPGNRCREYEEISKDMGKWRVGFSVSLREARGRVRSHCWGKRGREQQQKKKNHVGCWGSWKHTLSGNRKSERLRSGRDFNSWLKRTSLLPWSHCWDKYLQNHCSLNRVS